LNAVWIDVSSVVGKMAPKTYIKVVFEKFISTTQIVFIKTSIIDYIIHG
jgi:hypothetical protein